jgi:hypothetical protein
LFQDWIGVVQSLDDKVVVVTLQIAVKKSISPLFAPVILPSLLCS